MYSDYSAGRLPLYSFIQFLWCMVKLFSLLGLTFRKRFPRYFKPKLTQEGTFELDPAEILIDFCQKVKSLDKGNWFLVNNFGKGLLFYEWFANPVVVKYSDVTTVWNTKKIKIKYSYTVIDGFDTDLFEFFHNKERILILQKIKDYGKTFRCHQKKIEQVMPELNFNPEMQIAFLQNGFGEGVILEKFGHTHRWWIDDWPTVRQFVLAKIPTI